jgi:hypothetical protein
MTLMEDGREVVCGFYSNDLGVFAASDCCFDGARRCSSCGLYSQGGGLWGYRVDTGLNEDRANLEKRWAMLRWLKQSFETGEFQMTLVWHEETLAHEETVFFNDARLATLFKVWWC